jgi:ribokinase
VEQKGVLNVKPKIAVIGSINMDMHLSLNKYPEIGETIFANNITYFPGGKGANQAVSVSNMNAGVYMIGKIGHDSFGEEIIQYLNSKGVNTENIKLDNSNKTGIAIVTVDNNAENRIVLFRGANFNLSPKDINNVENIIQQVDIVMLQLEIPLETVAHAIYLAKKLNKFVILDPAPVPELPLPPEILKSIDLLIPNKIEAEILSGRSINDIRSAKLAASDILSLGVKKVIIKLGKEGALLAENNHFEYIEGERVKSIDTTAAGDAFAGALAAALLEEKSISSSIEFANKVGALTTEKIGAMQSIPTKADIDGHTWNNKCY